MRGSSANFPAEALRAPTGSLLIDLDQRRGRQAALLLEPNSPNSLFRYAEFATLITAEGPRPVYPLALPSAEPDPAAARSVH